MPVYLFTYHAYQTWLPDNRRGFVQEGQGVQPRNERLAASYRQAAAHLPFEFDADTQIQLIAKARAICAGDGHRLHGVVAEPSHLHALVSWRDAALAFGKVRGRIKNLLSLHLSKRAGVTGRPWFSTGSSRKRVEDQNHFNHLMSAYLPRHSGVGWYDDRGWTNLPPDMDPATLE
jgi:hypothetical protein